MAEKREPLREVNFCCTVKTCRTKFAAVPLRVEGDDDAPWHPWRYIGQCPDCGAECAQASWERAALKAWSHATGPTSTEGRARSAANLAGHPTPEESQRIRFNALKHGLNARVASYFPPRPGRYAECGTCQYNQDEQGRAYCRSQPACVQQAQLWMRMHAAFEQRRPELLNEIHADQQATLVSMVHQIMRQILAEGLTIRAPKYTADGEVIDFVDEDGARKIIWDVSAHPLLKALGELLSRNNLSLADMGMTAKVVDAEPEEMGQLAGTGDRQALTAYAERQAQAVENLASVMAEANALRRRDPVLIEHQAQERS